MKTKNKDKVRRIMLYAIMDGLQIDREERREAIRLLDQLERPGAIQMERPGAYRKKSRHNGLPVRRANV